MTWFKQLTGIQETSPTEVKQQLQQDGTQLHSLANGKSWTCGTLETPTLTELHERCPAEPGGKLTVRECVANVQQLHTDPANAGALFQVASQFNLLEMVAPSITPAQGVGRYEHDFTQGPACAIAAGAGTIYRNYFAPVKGQIGQCDGEQIDCLELVGEAIGNSDQQLWKMRNGYALPSSEGLVAIHQKLVALSEHDLDRLRGKLKVGIHWDTQVTLDDCQHLVSQVYASALPVAYSGLSATEWQPFATFVLEAAYDATLCAARINAAKTGNYTVFLTLLGGGAFGNDTRWIIDAIQRALSIHQHSGLDVQIVSYGSPNPSLEPLIPFEQLDCRNG